MDKKNRDNGTMKRRATQRLENVISEGADTCKNHIRSENTKPLKRNPLIRFRMM